MAFVKYHHNYGFINVMSDDETNQNNCLFKYSLFLNIQ